MTAPGPGIDRHAAKIAATSVGSRPRRPVVIASSIPLTTSTLGAASSPTGRDRAGATFSTVVPFAVSKGA